MKIIKVKARDGAAANLHGRLIKAYKGLDAVIAIVGDTYNNWDKILSDPEAVKLRSKLLLDMDAIQIAAKNVIEFAKDIQKEFEKKVTK